MSGELSRALRETEVVPYADYCGTIAVIAVIVHLCRQGAYTE